MTNNNGEIDSSRVPVEGVAGLGLAAMATIVAYALPSLRALIVPVLLGAAIVGLTLLAWRHRERRAAAMGGLILLVVALTAIAAALIAHHA